MTERELTPEELLAKMKADAAELEKRIADDRAAARPKAIEQTIALIKQHDIKRADLDTAWRQREYKKRGPRKTADLKAVKTAA